MSATDLKTLNSTFRTNSFIKGFTLTKADADQFEALFGSNKNVIEWLLRLAKCPSFDPFGSAAAEDDFELFGDDDETPAPAKKESKDDDDDFDLFGDQTEEEKQEIAEKLKKDAEARLAAKQKGGKSSLVIDVKPWDDETNMAELEANVRSIEMEGLVWGASKFVEVAFGVKKLQIMLTISDDLVSVDELEEKIVAFEDHIQSMDIVVFNKV
eukprot:GGOE01060847.1.p1 GENE.GGOE01060847.1~~GGOE01060847.1.p1  ORF type:complete len:225 (+),score=52.75 GGOE01060847.1:41-676(+)